MQVPLPADMDPLVDMPSPDMAPPDMTLPDMTLPDMASPDMPKDVLPPGAPEADHYLCPENNPQPFCTLTSWKQAEDVVMDGDTLAIYDGLYATCSQFFADDIHLIGFGPRTPVLRGSDCGQGVDGVHDNLLTFEGFGVTLENLALEQVRGARGERALAAEFRGGDVTLRSLSFRDVDTAIRYAARDDEARGDVVLEDIEITNTGRNQDGEVFHGVMVFDALQVRIERVTIAQIQNSGHGLWVARAKQVDLTCSSFASLDGTGSYMTHLQEVPSVSVTRSIFAQGPNVENTNIVRLDRLNALSFQDNHVLNEQREGRGTFLQFPDPGATEIPLPTIERNVFMGSGTHVGGLTGFELSDSNLKTSNREPIEGFRDLAPPAVPDVAVLHPECRP